jgi:exodeoxyribonuclease VII large subunit
MSEQEDSRSLVDEFEHLYSPATLLGVYASAIRTPADARLILARGVFQASQSPREYAGYYYDSLKGVNDNGNIKLRVPGLLRSKLENNQVYIFKGYVEKRVNFSAIELIFTVDEILRKEVSPLSEEDQKRFSLMQRKITRGFRDFEALVKQSVYANTPLRIANLYGTSAIVNKDFERGLAEAQSKFAITDYRCNFASKTEIIRWLRALSSTGAEVVAVVRGGGEGGLDIFNDPEIGAEALKLNAVLVSALGHAVNETLIDKLADKKFDLPHHYGSSLKGWVDQALEEQARSKSKFIEQVKLDLEKTYKDQITALTTQLEARNKEFQQSQQKFKELTEQNTRDKDEAIKAREQSFTAQLNALQEQIKTRESALKELRENYELTTKKEVELAQSQLATQMERLRMEKEQADRRASSRSWWLYLLGGLLIGLLAGLALKA